MKTVLVDTDVLSFLIKGDSRREQYQSALQDHESAISLMTIAELFQWAFIRQWAAERIANLEQFLFANFTVIPINLGTCRFWGAIRAECRRRGTPISPQDAWIAAVARQYNLPLVTHNAVDFVCVSGLSIITAGDR